MLMISGVVFLVTFQCSKKLHVLTNYNINNINFESGRVDVRQILSTIFKIITLLL